MMQDEFIGCPFERRIVGRHGGFLLRSDHEHAKRSATAIQRRNQPAWSRFSEELRAA
jgi:hypothetical protein